MTAYNGKTHEITRERNRYIVTVKYDKTHKPIVGQQAFFYRTDRNAVRQMARFIRDNA